MPSTSGCSPGLAPTCRLLKQTDSCSAWHRWACLCLLLPVLRDRHQHPFYRLGNQSSDSTNRPRSWPGAMTLELEVRQGDSAGTASTTQDTAFLPETDRPRLPDLGVYRGLRTHTRDVPQVQRLLLGAWLQDQSQSLGGPAQNENVHPLFKK